MNLQMSDGRMIAAKDLLNPSSSEALVLTPEELDMEKQLNNVWKGIVNKDVCLILVSFLISMTLCRN